MALIRVSEAARRGFASRTTIYKAVKAGRLTLKAGEQDEKLVDVADLVRLYGEPSAGAAAQGPGSIEAPLVTTLRRENEMLLHELEAVRRDARDNLERSHERERELLDLLKASYRLLEHRPDQRQGAGPVVDPPEAQPQAPTVAEETPLPASPSAEPAALAETSMPAPDPDPVPAPEPVSPPATSVKDIPENGKPKTGGRVWRKVLWLMLCAAAVAGGAYLASAT